MDSIGLGQGPCFNNLLKAWESKGLAFKDGVVEFFNGGDFLGGDLYHLKLFSILKDYSTIFASSFSAYFIILHAFFPNLYKVCPSHYKLSYAVSLQAP